MYYLNPTPKDAHVMIFYRNFMAENPKMFCHVGLGINSLHTTKILRNNKLRTDVYGVWTAAHIETHLTNNPTVTHVLIEAPWVSIEQLQLLLFKFPQVHFIIRAHSQIGFLQVEAGAIKLIRDMLSMQDGVLNLTVAANSIQLSNFIEQTYNVHCLYLPNLYTMERINRKKGTSHDHKILRISSFGAIRLLKNHTSAAAASLMIAKQRQCDLEFWISSNREEHGKGIVQALRNMFSNLPWAKLIENPWQSWSDFRHTVSHMDLCMQASMTETFNITIADAVAEGVPIVVSPVIEWAPSECKADPDMVEDIARVGHTMLNDPFAPERNLKALTKFQNDAVNIWLNYLNDRPDKIQER